MSSAGKFKVNSKGRTTQQRRTGKKSMVGEQFIAHSREMRESVAWSLLNGNVKLILERVELEHMRHGGSENGNLPVTYSDFVEGGVRRAAIASSIATAEALGFIECMDRGRAAKAEHRFPAIYRGTYFMGNLTPTNEWKAITTKEEGERRIANALEALGKRTAPLRETLQSARDRKAASDRLGSERQAA